MYGRQFIRRCQFSAHRHGENYTLHLQKARLIILRIEISPLDFTVATWEIFEDNAAVGSKLLLLYPLDFRLKLF